MRRTAACWLAGLALGCAGAPPPEPAAPAAEAATPEAPPSPERARFEAFKAEGTADPREAFARRAATEAERRRQRALDATPRVAPHAVEREMELDAQHEETAVIERVAGLGVWGASLCFREEPDWSAQSDFIRHRQLTRDDFREEEPREVEAAVEVSGTAVGAYVGIAIVCVIDVRHERLAADRHVVSLRSVRYFPILSRYGSWWNPASDAVREWVLRHEQLHFDVAELVADELETETEALRHELRGAGATPEAALVDFQQRWGRRMEKVQSDFRAIERQYDRETLHGTDFARQTEWFARVKRGLGAVRAGLAEGPTLLR